MVLEFGLLKTGLFQESENVGDGLGTSAQQVIIREAKRTKYAWTQIRFDNTTPTTGSLMVHTSTTWTYVNGTITKRTIDGGKTWTDATTEVANLVFSIRSRTGSTKGFGWANGATNIGYTTDSGDNWTASTIVGATTYSNFNCVDFPTSTIAVAGITRGGGTTPRSILYSTDGGQTWTVCATGPTANIFSICMFDASTGYATDSAENIWKTTNGGVDWTDTTHNVLGQEDATSNAFALTSTKILHQTPVVAGTVGPLELYDNIAGSITYPFFPPKTTWTSNFVKATNQYIYFVSGVNVSVTNQYLFLNRSLDNGVTWECLILPYPAGDTASTMIKQTQLSEYDENKLVIHLGGGTFLLVDETEAS